MLLLEARDKFLSYLIHRRNASKDTIKTYRPVINKFIDFAGDIDASAITIKVIDSYAEYLFSLGTSPRTMQNKLAIIRSFVRFLYAKEYNDLRPESVEMPRRVIATEMVYLTEDEAEALKQAARKNKRDYALICTILSSGIRVSEACNLQVGDIMKTTLVVKHGKGNKTRCTFISLQAKLAIDRLNISEGHIFRNQFGEPFSRMGVLNIVKKYAKAAGIKKKVGVHTLRHTFATLYLENGGRIEDLQQLLGHTNISTTLIYLHFSNSHLKNAYETVEKFRKSKVVLDNTAIVC